MRDTAGRSSDAYDHAAGCLASRLPPFEQGMPLAGAIMQRFEVCPKGVQVTDFCFSSNSKLIMFGCDDTNIGILNMRGTKQVEFTATDHEPNYTCT